MPRKAWSRFWSKPSSIIYVDQLVAGELRDFMLERVQHYFREVRGYKYDEVNAVLAVGVTTLKDVEARLAAVAKVRPDAGFRAARRELQTHQQYS